MFNMRYITSYNTILYNVPWLNIKVHDVKKNGTIVHICHCTVITLTSFYQPTSSMFNMFVLYTVFT